MAVAEIRGHTERAVIKEQLGAVALRANDRVSSARAQRDRGVGRGRNLGRLRPGRGEVTREGVALVVVADAGEVASPAPELREESRARLAQRIDRRHVAAEMLAHAHGDLEM